jgi:GTP cyclohydrolase II
VPLNGGLPARFVVFRDSVGGTSVAIIVGAPDFSRPVPVRMHSACLTGDVFGSRRCDCGDQLRLALAQLEQQGGGIILYLEQEGRGLGLANKMRTYQLQDAGLDTVDANTVLGFDDDERDYGVAVRMLQILGCTRVKVLTNNPAKLEGLAAAGIEVSGRVPLHGPINADNRRYLTAKATRAGHKLDHLLGALADATDASPEPVGGGQAP